MNCELEAYQRGDSGQKYTWTQTIIGGILVEASIHLHGEFGPPMIVTS